MDKSFGTLLRGHRRASGLTQEALAERASLSAQAVGALERGDRRYPRQDTVIRLADALGLSGELRTVFTAAASRRGVPAPDARGLTAIPRVAPRQLPAAVANFTGREPQVDSLITLLERSSTAVVVSAVAGMGGIGKTALAVYVGHRLADRFPDGQLYLDLGGYGPGEPMLIREALRRLISALDGPVDEIATDVAQAATRYRSRLAGRRVLVVLDNAADTAQVAPLLPGTAGSAAIVTSRRAMSTLAQAHHVTLDVLSEAEAVRLLAATAGRSRVDAEPAAAPAIVRHCGRLPLAIHLVAARLVTRPHWPIAHVAQRLEQEYQRLDELDCDDVGVRASFAVSIDQLADSPDALDQQAAAAYALLGLRDGQDISTTIAARLLDLPEREAERILERLANLHLPEATSPNLYRMHDLLRLYAGERAETISGPDRAAAITRVLELYVAVAWRSMTLVNPNSVRSAWADERWSHPAPGFRDSNEAFAWLDGQRPHLVQVTSQAQTTPGVPGELVVRLALGLFTFYDTRGHWLDWSRVCRAALDQAAVGSDRLAQAMVRMDLGLAHAGLAQSGAGGYEEALDHLQRSLDEFETLVDKPGTGMCLTNLCDVLERSGDLGEAIACGQRALAICTALGGHSGEATVCESLGILYGKVGDRDRELAYYERARAISERLGHDRGTAGALQRIGGFLRHAGRHDEALPALRRSVLLYQQSGDRLGEMTSLDQLGALHLELGEHATALEILTDGLALAQTYRDRRRQASLLHHMGTALAGTDRQTKARQHWQAALALFHEHDPPTSQNIRELLDDPPTSH